MEDAGTALAFIAVLIIFAVLAYIGGGYAILGGLLGQVLLVFLGIAAIAAICALVARYILKRSPKP